MISPDNPYTKMQREFYAAEAEKWSPENRDPVVGAWDAHNAWADYDLLFEGLETAGKIALDFGCGPGRMIFKYGSRFKRIDGADISLTNIINARKVIGNAPAVLIQTNGVDLKEFPMDAYDVVFSTICLQHIPVHQIRLNLFKEFHRVLKPGGWFTAQMAYSTIKGSTDADYYEDRFHAEATNGCCDVLVSSWVCLDGDLGKVGFKNFSHVIRPVGPNDRHPNWIFFRAQK